MHGLREDDGKSASECEKNLLRHLPEATFTYEIGKTTIKITGLDLRALP
jgi:hypothetical protein